MVTLLGILLTFILTVVVGNKIIQSRQQDGWIAQQRYSGQEKEYFELKKLCEEIASLSNIRIYAMKRLALQLSSKSYDPDRDSIGDYKEATKAWNQNLGSIYVRLSQLGKTRYRYSLESELHNPMMRASIELDKAIHDTPYRKKLAPVISELNRITRSALKYNGSLLREVHDLRKYIYFPEKIIFSRSTMSYFSTWQLVKAVLVADINRISVIRSPLNP